MIGYLQNALITLVNLLASRWWIYSLLPNVIDIFVYSPRVGHTLPACDWSWHPGCFCRYSLFFTLWRIKSLCLIDMAGKIVNMLATSCGWKKGKDCSSRRCFLNFLILLRQELEKLKIYLHNTTYILYS